jgi:serine/threonine-protein kinase
MDNLTSKSTRIFKTGHVLNDKWVIIEFIGKGAMGEVYRAHQLNLKRDVAIKVISQEMLQSFEEDPEEIEIAIERFRREVQAMARVRHHNVLQIFDYGSEIIHKDDHDLPVEYIAMEFIPGSTLRFTMSEEGFYPEQDLIVAWLSDFYLPLLEGVEAIHAKDISHRDLKPENVLMDGKTPKIADFGLACSICMKPVTQSMDVKGTPAYMSPEHFFDFKNADQQSDIYSLGKILYEAVDGKITSNVLPFKSVALANSDTAFLKKIDQIILDATAEKKKGRLKSVSNLRIEILEAMDILKSGTVPDAREIPKRFAFLHQPRFVWAGIFIATVSMALMGLWHLMGEPGKKATILKSHQVSRIESSKPSPIKPSKAEPAKFILGRDGIRMHFIPGGEVETRTIDSTDQEQTVQISSFYMDEKMVTNHHFIEFLNEVKKNVTVENGIVKNEDEVWLYLGEGTDMKEQIIYEHGRFHLRDTKYAANPVVRVTWYGASAYANHYGKRLATEYEWDYVVSEKDLRNKILLIEKTDTLQSDIDEAPARTETNTHMMDMGSSSDNTMTHDKPSNNKRLGKKFREWMIRSEVGKEYLNETGRKENIFYPSLVFNNSKHSSLKFKSFRYPWEAFLDVGFRCALNLGNEL